MTNPTQTTITQMRLTSRVAEKRIKELAQHSDNIIIGNHARERMVERGIDDHDVLKVLRLGHVDEEPELTEFNEWKCKMTFKIRGARSIGVVTIFLHSGRLFVKTVEWEDLP